MRYGYVGDAFEKCGRWRGAAMRRMWVGCGCAAHGMGYIENECFSNDEDSDRDETEGIDLDKNLLQVACRIIIQREKRNNRRRCWALVEITTT